MLDPLAQLIAGLSPVWLVTAPTPLPASVTVNAKLAVVLKVAVTACAAFIVTTQLPVPLHAPLHPANVEPSDAVGVNVTAVPVLKVDEQPTVDPVSQAIPAGVLITPPSPVPAVVTVSRKPTGLNVAITVNAEFIVSVHVPVPVQPKFVQPPNVEPALGVAVSVTTVPIGKLAVHGPGIAQESPVGTLLIVPLPVPAPLTCNA